jgi:hypothetical protein
LVSSFLARSRQVGRSPRWALFGPSIVVVLASLHTASQAGCWYREARVCFSWDNAWIFLFQKIVRVRYPLTLLYAHTVCLVY